MIVAVAADCGLSNDIAVHVSVQYTVLRFPLPAQRLLVQVLCMGCNLIVQYCCG